MEYSSVESMRTDADSSRSSPARVRTVPCGVLAITFYFNAGCGSIVDAWIIADLAFVHVGVSNGLIGLTIQSLVFTYHGYLRVTHRKQTGLFTFTKA